MALPKVCGIETEYGIIVRGGESNPVSASSLLINAFMATISDRRAPRTGWDFNDEQPGNDARGFSLDEAIIPELETSLVNAVLTNGARYYVDHAHPEISNPETTTALEAVRWDRAAEEVIRISVDAANSQLAQSARASRQQPGEIVVYKNNS
ncbi:MAG TPA: proteasome accessory factor PafA2 family protein, partial [Desertimonas sp.]|nr:proteasome accessory factor PafA2 family protein [Desertimonas sp.]